VEKIEVCVRNFVVVCLFRSVNNNYDWVFAGVYCPNDNVER
jgi:hypothetical protein